MGEAELVMDYLLGIASFALFIFCVVHAIRNDRAFPWIFVLIFLPGMLKDNLRSYIWLCFVCLGYFMILVQRIFAQPDSLLVVIGLVAVVILFTAAMLYVRWRARELRAVDES